jgi:trans-aconitate methyltransferase
MASNRPNWDSAYLNKPAETLSWFENQPSVSVALMAKAGLEKDDAIVDVGAGASPVLVALAKDGFGDLTAIELSGAALETLQNRLPAGAQVDTVIADICAWQPKRHYDLWHDRAVLHFLTETADRAAYVATLNAALPPGGHAVIGAFAPDGPDKCFGQPIQKYDAESLMALLGQEFVLIEERRHTHVTPGGTEQRYFYALVQRQE